MSAKSTLCILFRDEEVQAVLVDRNVLGIQIKFMERLPRDEDVYAAVAGLVESAEKTPARVLLCPPREMMMQRTLTYPAMDPADIGNMIQFEATRHVPIPEGERSLGWSHIDEEAEKKLVLNLVAARGADIQGLVARFTEVGVPVDEAVPFSSAIVPALGGQPTLLVVTDDRHVELCLYGGGQLRDSQVLSSSMPNFTPEKVVSTARQMTAKNRGWLGMEGIGRVIRTGAAELSATFEADLGAAFGLPVQPLEVPDGFPTVELPLADVLLAASTELPREMNLIEFAGRKVPISRKTILVASLCTLLAVELAGWIGFRTGAPAIQRRKVAAEIAKVKRRSAPIQRMKDKNREMRKQLYRLDEIARSHVSAMQVLGDLSTVLPSDTYLQLVYYKPGTLHIRGLSKEPDRITELLMQEPYVEAVSRSEIGKKEGDYHSITITVTTRTSDEEI